MEISEYKEVYLKFFPADDRLEWIIKEVLKEYFHYGISIEEDGRGYIIIKVSDADLKEKVKEVINRIVDAYKNDPIMYWLIWYIWKKEVLKEK